jgi:hypothetical protein
VFGDLFGWYNHEHRHAGLGLLTPHDVHHGLALAKIERREIVLAQAYAAHPERFVRGLPRPPALPREVWINRPPVAPVAPIGAAEGAAAQTDLATASRTNDPEAARGSTTPQPEEIVSAVAQ